MSLAAQREQENNDLLQSLAGKLSTLRGVTEDIHRQAEDTSTIDNLTNVMGNMFTSLKHSSVRLARTATAGHPIWRTVGLALLIFFILYTLLKFI